MNVDPTALLVILMSIYIVHTLHMVCGTHKITQVSQAIKSTVVLQSNIMKVGC